MRRSIPLRISYSVLLISWLLFIWVRAKPSDSPGSPVFNWSPVVLLFAQIIYPTMLGWSAIAIPEAIYGVILIVGLARGNQWMVEGLAWWSLAVAVLVADLITKYSRSARTHSTIPD